MARFLPIPGSCHGARFRRQTGAAPEADGHAARAIDLPGHGEGLPPPETGTLNAEPDAVLDTARPGRICSGQSTAGASISAAASRAPDDRHGLICLCAYAPGDGLSPAQMRRRAGRLPPMRVVRRSEHRLTCPAAPARARSVCYRDDRTVMGAAFDADRVQGRTASHSPVLSRPGDLARLQGRIAADL